MSIFQTKPSSIFYLRRQDAVLVTRSSSMRLSIPLEVVSNLDVRDPKTLTEIVAQFLHAQKIHGQQLLIVLDNAVVFQKQTTADAAGDSVLKDFASKVPLEPAAKQFMIVRQDSQATGYAVNRTWYEAIVAGIRQANKVKGVIPAALYGVHEGKKVDKTVVKAFFENSRPLREANFLTKV